MTCPNFLLVNQEVAPLTIIAEFRTPYAPVSEIEENFRARSAGRLGAPDCVIRFRCHTALPFIAYSRDTAFSGRAHICMSRGELANRYRCADAACSFITLAAWVRQLPFWLLNSRVVTEYLHSGHLNALKPFISVMA